LIDRDLANLYLHRFKQLQKELELPGEVTIETILRSPGVISSSEQGLLDPTTRAAVDTALDLALEQLLRMRAKEGANLHHLGRSGCGAALFGAIVFAMMPQARGQAGLGEHDLPALIQAFHHAFLFAAALAALGALTASRIPRVRLWDPAARR
jgi:hypothetical protein